MRAGVQPEWGVLVWGGILQYRGGVRVRGGKMWARCARREFSDCRAKTERNVIENVNER